MPHVLSPITPKYLKLLNPQRRNLYKRVGPKHTSTCLALHLKRTQESARSGHSELPNRFSPKRVGKRGHAAHKLRQMHSQPRLLRSRRRGPLHRLSWFLSGPPSAACKSGHKFAKAGWAALPVLLTALSRTPVGQPGLPAAPVVSFLAPPCVSSRHSRALHRSCVAAAKPSRCVKNPCVTGETTLSAL